MNVRRNTTRAMMVIPAVMALLLGLGGVAHAVERDFFVETTDDPGPGGTGKFQDYQDRWWACDKESNDNKGTKLFVYKWESSVRDWVQQMVVVDEDNTAGCDQRQANGWWARVGR